MGPCWPRVRPVGRLCQLASEVPESWIGGNWHRLAVVAIAGAVGLSVIRYLDTREATMKQSAALAEKKLQLEVEEAKQTKAQEKAAYIAKRRGECYANYDKERQKWNNVQGPEYDAEEDVCRIRYEEPKQVLKPKDCAALKVGRFYYDCITSTFTNDF